jgi:polyadenylate-binding protein
MTVRCESHEAYQDLCEKLRYFTFEGKECRSLGFNENLHKKTPEEKIDTQKMTVFVKGIPKSMSQQKLHSIYQVYGTITSLKISRNVDHTSKGFGYICFDSEGAAENAVKMGPHIKPD